MTIDIPDHINLKADNSFSVFTIMREILLRDEKIDQEKEHFWMLGLARNNRILYIELISLGGVSSTVIEPMNVYRFAVMKGSVKVIMIHNHPSGGLEPSENDKAVTDRLIQVGKILNIKVIDHLIISTSEYYSFVDSGLLKKLEKSTEWLPQFELIKRIREEEEKLRNAAQKKGKNQGKKEGEKAKAIKIAKEMIKADEPIEKIIKYTGLKAKEIQKLREEN